MSKEAEQNYLALIGSAGKAHNLEKPFSDGLCGSNLASIGTIMTLLPEPPARILDMGCGAGWTSVFFAKRGYEVVGQEISQDMIDLANENKAQHHLDERLSFVCRDYEETSAAGDFDAVVFFDCLHHADDERAALASAHRALKPGGIVITHEPGEGHAISPGSIEAMEQFGVSERDMPPHLIIRHGEEIGFKASRIYPMQDEVLEILYRQPVPPRYSKQGRWRAERMLEMAFCPSDRRSSIVVMTK
ncbi:MAG: class I SAM-dependent methyltransferase [Pseudomonadota bacterium]|nr:class I SAM-dependent methyltransferase [Pseudomonadota bacterium]